MATLQIRRTHIFDSSWCAVALKIRFKKIAITLRLMTLKEERTTFKLCSFNGTDTPSNQTLFFPRFLVFFFQQEKVKKANELHKNVDAETLTKISLAISRNEYIFYLKKCNSNRVG